MPPLNPPYEKQRGPQASVSWLDVSEYAHHSGSSDHSAITVLDSIPRMPLGL